MKTFVSTLVIAAALAFPILPSLADPPSLLASATRLLDISTVKRMYGFDVWDYYAWKSQDVVVTLEGATNKDMGILEPRPPARDAHQLVLVQVPSGQKQLVLDTTAHDKEAFPALLSAVDISPDGQWALLQESKNGTQTWLATWMAVNLKTHRVRAAPVLTGMQTIEWCPRSVWSRDSRHWLLLTGDSTLPVVQVYSLAQPAKPTKLYLQPFPNREYEFLVGLTARGTMLAIQWPLEKPLVHLYEFAIEGGVGADQDHKVPIHVTEIPLPPGADRSALYGWALSPQGDRLAWMIVVKSMDTKLPDDPGHGELWVSNVDGSTMHLLGCLGTDYHRKGVPKELDYGPVAEDDADKALPMQIRWLPDGKQLSFLYEKSLWTIPVN